MATLATILPSPPGGLIFSGNIPDIRIIDIDPDDGVKFQLYVDYNTPNQLLLLDENLFGNQNNETIIKIKGAIETALFHVIPDQDVFKQVNAVRRFSIWLDEAPVYTASVVKGGIDIPRSEFGTYNYQLYFITNLLSWCPTVRNVKYREPVFVNYMNLYTGGTILTAKYYWIDQNQVQQQTCAIYNMPSYGLYTLNISFNKLVSIIENNEGRVGIFAIDLYVTYVGNQISNTQRLWLVNDFNENDDVFAFTNSLGGLDTIRFTGPLTIKPNHKSITFRNINDELIEYQNTPETIFEKKSGYYEGNDHQRWVNDFLISYKRFHFRFTESNIVAEPIVVTDISAAFTPANINSCSFEFKYASQHPWQWGTREALPPIENYNTVQAPEVGDMPPEFNNDFLNQTSIVQITQNQYDA